MNKTDPAMESSKKVQLPRKDPWARFEAWRYHPDSMPLQNMKRMFPGIGIGFGVFLVACVVEKFFFEEDEKHGHH